MPFSLEMVKMKRNLEYHEGTEKPKYFFELDLSQVVRGGVSATLPIYWRPNKSPHPLLKEIYWTEMAGAIIEKGNLATLEQMIPQAVMGIMDFNTIPYYYIHLPGEGRAPVYLSEGKLRLRLRGQPEFTGDDIGQLWHRLGDYLTMQKKIASKEDVEVSVLLWKELKLFPSAFVLGNGKAWLPIFYSRKEDKAQLIYDVIGVPSRFLSVEEAFDLRREVAQSLISSRMLSSPYDLKMVQVQEEIWEKLKVNAQPTGFALTYFTDSAKIEIPVYETKGEVFSATRGSKIRLTFSSSMEELSFRVSGELSRRGVLSTSASVSVEKMKGR